jgi:hypothetical protein
MTFHFISSLVIPYEHMAAEIAGEEIDLAVDHKYPFHSSDYFKVVTNQH